MKPMTMLLRRLHRLPLLWLLIFSLLISPASTFGYVWCVSADGHATLETALAGDCGMDTPVPPAEDRHVLTFSAETNDCGPCLDISSSPHWGVIRTNDSDAPATIPAADNPVTIAPLPCRPDQFLTGPLIPEVTPRIPDPILVHRTIVLLI